MGLSGKGVCGKKGWLTGSMDAGTNPLPLAPNLTTSAIESPVQKALNVSVGDGAQKEGFLPLPSSLGSPSSVFGGDFKVLGSLEVSE